eukprot:Nitzschia sp. Nitz4//scaffold114_size70088//36299//38756//NITZ4_005978-RA/size70088-augustus-gene-0.5-mRNA-1//1//CDS//3329533426//4603//frame0
MSLATGGVGLGGAGAGGGLVMAHQANAMAQPTAPPPPTGGPIPGGATGAPSTVAALGADLVDKQQRLSLQQLKDMAKYPLLALDLYAKELHVVTFPAMPPAGGALDPDTLPLHHGVVQDQFSLQATETAHKTFRKFLSKSKGYESLLSDVMTNNTSTSSTTTLVQVDHPQLWLGLRRLADAPEHLRAQVPSDDSTSPVIAEETSQSLGITMVNSTLDGSSLPQGDDFDRVVSKLRLCTSKKALTVLPEEWTSLLFHQAQALVKEEEELPRCIAVPAVYCNDPTLEALQDAAGGSAVFFQRSICALAGSLIHTNTNQISAHLSKVYEAMRLEFQRTEMVQNPNAHFDDELLVILMGTTTDTVECTAVQVSHVQENAPLCCTWGNFKVLSSVSRRHATPETQIDACLQELYAALEVVAADAASPVVMVSYGTEQEQLVLHSHWKEARKSFEDWEQVPSMFTHQNTVAVGAAVLGAVSHGRLTVVQQLPDKKPKAIRALQVQNVAPVAVGVRMHYHGGRSNHSEPSASWTPIKSIFDFDRRVPAGPYPLEFSAAECAVYRTSPHLQGNPQEEAKLNKAIQSNEGAKGIPKREEAALDLRVQILQQWTRNGKWIPVGDIVSPLVHLDRDEKKIAYETMTMELSLGATGLLAMSLVGERASVVQANTNARNSKIAWYVGVFLAVAFFGGFLVKSWWEERVFERDTRRLLAYYKNVIPGSISDGDTRNAKYLVWKYRNSKNKLWKQLEKKYGEPVLYEHEWAEKETTATPSTAEAEENLDEEPSTEEEL